jgi:hypothetical protein
MEPMTLALILGGAQLAGQAGGAIAEAMTEEERAKRKAHKDMIQQMEAGGIGNLGMSQSQELKEMGEGLEALGLREGLANLQQAMAQDTTGGSGISAEALSNIFTGRNQAVSDLYKNVKDRSGALAASKYNTLMNMGAPGYVREVAEAVPSAIATGAQAGSTLADQQAQAGALAASGQTTAEGAKAVYDPATGYQWRKS